MVFTSFLPSFCPYGDNDDDDGETLIWFPCLTFRSHQSMIESHSIVHRKVEEFDRLHSRVVVDLEEEVEVEEEENVKERYH